MYRRSLLAMASAAALAQGARAAGRDTDTVRLTWGFGGLPLIAKERGEFAKTLAKDNIRVEWVGPFPNHAPTIQAVVGGSADFSFGRQHDSGPGRDPGRIATGCSRSSRSSSPLPPRSSPWTAPASTAYRTWWARPSRSIGPDWASSSWSPPWKNIASIAARLSSSISTPPEAAPAFGSGQVDAWAMWSPGVDLARTNTKVTTFFWKAGICDFQIDFNSWLVRKEFAERNRDLVGAVNAAFTAEAEWASDHSVEAETISQVQGHYDDAIRDMFISWKRQFHIHRADDQAFLAELQRAADWLSARKVLPQQVHVADHLALV